MGETIRLPFNVHFEQKLKEFFVAPPPLQPSYDNVWFNLNICMRNGKLLEIIKSYQAIAMSIYSHVCLCISVNAIHLVCSWNAIEWYILI